MEQNITPLLIERKLKAHTPKPEGNYGRFSVMVLLFNIDGHLEILYQKRSEKLKRQPGDVCFPGGKSEGYETPLQTAFRETREEIGIKATDIKILGTPDFIVTPFNTHVTPFLGYAENVSLSDIKINSAEVEKVFTVPLQFFMENEPLKSEIYLTHRIPEDFPFDKIVNGKNYQWGRESVLPELFYEYNGNIIWGMTARITNNICSILKNQ